MKKKTKTDMTNIQKLVGDISESNLKHVDYYVSDNFGIFIPSVGFCEYAIMPRHTHPGYYFVLFFSQEQSITPVKIEILPEHYLVTVMAPGMPMKKKNRIPLPGIWQYLLTKTSMKKFIQVTIPNHRQGITGSSFWLGMRFRPI